MTAFCRKRVTSRWATAGDDSSTWTTSGSAISAPNNFAFDELNNVISINTTFGATAVGVVAGAYGILPGGVTLGGEWHGLVVGDDRRVAAAGSAARAGQSAGRAATPRTEQDKRPTDGNERKGTDMRHRALLAVLTVLAMVVASTVVRFAWYDTGTDPSTIYFSTITRAAGLLAGVALGLFWIPRRLRPRPGDAIDTT